MRIRLSPLLGCLALALGGAAARAGSDSAPSRTFEFSYRATVRDLPASAREVDVWLPLPESDAAQSIGALRLETPGAVEIRHDLPYGNSVLHVHLAASGASTVTVGLSADVTRHETAPRQEPLAPAMRARLLAPDQLVPIDGKIRAVALQVTRGKKTDREKAKAIYDYVTSTMKYDKSGTGWGRGDAIYACDVGKGNCTDFHSLIIGMARAVGIPARFSIGFPLPEKRGEGEVPGYHCWADLYVDGAWVPLDSSEAAKNPARRAYFFGHQDENRIQFTTGRDLKWEGGPRSAPLNYFIYPVVEVDGKPYTAVDRQFRFRDRQLPGAL